MKQARFMLFAIGIIGVIVIIWMISLAFDKKPSVLSKSVTTVASGNAATITNSSNGEVPWDYQVQQVKVGDLIDGDMVLLPNNERISNDQNFATGDSIYVLNYMFATMKIDSQGKNDVTLSQWKPIKTFKTKEEADKDISELKVEIKTDVKLIGVYKTELEGKSRFFAVAELPTGQKVKQPIPEERYKSFKDKKEVSVVLEEVHDYTNYDQSMAKFRGWAE
ncbi:signal peptide protein [Paenibacillus roseipurpureus]|uniref:Signal peptide protein n=1 Tax=Paenibacillus roseopurpureus TaxID=2918901 RepID=A0AA96LMQ6_9BACL|nr:signal peptide protein [Paenibacillus sp. MBLB1832]WNR43391.1 signal peptide protein [Paenibacillus sp. MBLB1832]